MGLCIDVTVLSQLEKTWFEPAGQNASIFGFSP
jgi:hypothetical protein